MQYRLINMQMQLTFDRVQPGDVRSQVLLRHKSSDGLSVPLIISLYMFSRLAVAQRFNK
jgi:hypothetical protein